MSEKRAISEGRITGAVAETRVYVDPSQRPLEQGRTRHLLTRDDGDGSATVSLQYSPTGEAGSWYEEASITLGTTAIFEAMPGLYWRINVSGGTAPDMYYWIF